MDFPCPEMTLRPSKVEDKFIQVLDFVGHRSPEEIAFHSASAMCGPNCESYVLTAASSRRSTFRMGAKG